ncbi:hypothetical protein JCM33374_g546 [Metschnikowia sp. JCM 33374]|nr:hypothetical protein JCM33374_g546 [Metschnikowia sp. JCM 33374]
MYLNIAKPKKSHIQNRYPRIVPINDDFNWRECEPFYLRPFAGKRNFNPSMAVHNISKQRDQLFLIENTYVDATNIRRKNLETFEHKILHCNQSERSKNAVREFYSMSMQFMTERYPQYFEVNKEKGKIYNRINEDIFPISGDNQDPMYLLRVLTGNLEEDVIIMLKDDPKNEDDEYFLRASLTGSPAGFDPSANFDKPVSHIHDPVPQYQSRLASPMHRFFNKLEPKDLWQRANWSIQTNNELFKLEEHHGRSGDEIRELSMYEIDFENGCFMRCERQLLTRLPNSRAVIMLVRTYLTPVKKIKEEGLGAEMAKSIESLPEDLAFYKRRESWGKAVCEYLRL